MRNTPGPQLRIVLQSYESCVRIVICDNAGGVTIEPIEKIFELYSGEKGSSGMGLYMSRLIIREKFHGEIEAYNVDNGACFRIDLPRYAMV
ncbi:MAG: HAMP domain-containing histidine kinase [Campylobacterales bacterium]|nr:HAMP domain-containing histidine kinase [Campylobacterales bacterium]